jgi:hypothetical protein
MRRWVSSEVSELLRDHEQVAVEHLDVVPDCRLQVCALENLLLLECGAGHLDQHAIGHVVEHRTISPSHLRINELLDHVQVTGRCPGIPRTGNIR